MCRTGTMKRAGLALLIVGSAFFAGCSIQQLAINSLSNVLAEGNSVFESDNDPAFIAEALPFSLKLIDALLNEDPDNQNLLLAAASGYVFYGYAYLDVPGEELAFDDIDAARNLRARARNLFLRAHTYSGRAFDVSYPGISARLLSDPESAVMAVGGVTGLDVDLLYWNAVSLSLAISSSRNDAALLARMPEVEAQLDHALTLDEAWDEGALHEFAINAAPLTHIDDATVAQHFERALDLSGGKRASLFVSLAEATAVPEQDRAAFVDLLERALAVDVDGFPELRLVNTVAQNRATWLLDNIDELILE